MGSPSAGGGMWEMGQGRLLSPKVCSQSLGPQDHEKLTVASCRVGVQLKGRYKLASKVEWSENMVRTEAPPGTLRRLLAKLGRGEAHKIQ